MAKEFLLHGSNFALILFAIALMAAGFAGHPVLSPWLVLLGAVLFELTEYSTHRFMFHAKPSRNAWLRAKQHRLHYDHHAEPARIDLLFLPLWYVVPNMILVGGIAYLVVGDWGRVASLLLGATFALLNYEWVHYIAHRNYTPKTPWGRWMKHYHLKHHFVNEHYWFGVSNPLGDLAIGTYRGNGEVTRSRTTRTLFGKPGNP